MWNARLDEAEAWIEIARRKINNIRHADDTILMPESKWELNSLFMKVKNESEKASLKLSIHKTQIMASGPITLWQINGEKKWKQWQTLFSCTPKSLHTVTAAMKLNINLKWYFKKKENKCFYWYVDFSACNQECDRNLLLFYNCNWWERRKCIGLERNNQQGSRKFKKWLYLKKEKNVVWKMKRGLLI